MNFQLIAEINDQTTSPIIVIVIFLILFVVGIAVVIKLYLNQVSG